MLFSKNSQNTLKNYHPGAKHIKNYDLVTAEPPLTVKTIDCVHQTGPKKGTQHPAVYYPSA